MIWNKFKQYILPYRSIAAKRVFTINRLFTIAIILYYPTNLVINYFYTLTAI